MHLLRKKSKQRKRDQNTNHISSPSLKINTRIYVFIFVGGKSERSNATTKNIRNKLKVASRSFLFSFYFTSLLFLLLLFLLLESDLFY